MAIVSALLMLGLSHASPALAGPVTDAKRAHHVGERPDGYLGAVRGNDASDAIKALVKKTNAERKKAYKKIADQRGAKLATVEALAGKKRIEKAETGTNIMTKDGKWVRKP